MSKGRIFPKFRADLLECAVVAKRMREGEIEATVVPRNPLDVLAQQIVAMAAAGEEWSVPELHELVRRAYPYAELSRALLDNVLDMLDGRYPSEEFARAAAADRLGPRGTTRSARARARASWRSPTPGTIPDRGLYGVHLPDGRRVGELDEEMVYEARAGPDVPARRDHLADRGDHARPRDRHARARRARARCRSGRATASAGRSSWAARSASSRAGRSTASPARAGRATTTSTSAPPSNLVAYLREQREATRVVPSDRTIVVERFRDEIGDWRLCVLSPFGGRVHAAWALALSARIRDELGLEADAIWSDDGIIVHLPDADEPPRADLVLVEPDELEDLVMRELGGSALFGARFRENAARALLIPRAYPGKRTPLWQQRLKAQSLLEVAKRYGQFPIVLETYRECLRDVFDLPGARGRCCAGCTRASCRWSRSRRQRASPFASSLLFDYVATYMYEGDTPNAERRAAALSLDRDLLRELLGQEELRDLIDPDALDEVEADLQRLSERTRGGERRPAARRAARARRPDRRRGAGALPRRGVGASAMLDRARGASAARCRCGSAARSAGSPPRTPASTATRSARCRRAACPRRSSSRSRSRSRGSRAATRARTARSRPRELAGRYGVDPLARCCASSSAPASWCAASCARAAREREWCDTEVLRRLRRASLAALRKEVEPAEQRALARFLPAWQGIDRSPPGGAGVDRLREVLVPLQGLALAPEVWERDVLPRRVGAYSPAWLDQLCAARRARLGRRGRARARSPAGWRSTSARTRRWLGPPPIKGERPAERAPRRAARAARARRLLLDRPARRHRRTSSRPSCRRRCGIWSGRAR